LNLQRNQQLFDRGIAAGKEVEDARAQLASGQSALEQANAALSTADRNVERAVGASPIAGQVVKRMVSVGEQVDGTAAQPIAEIANLDRVELAANVPAEYLSRIRVGQSAIVATTPRGPDVHRIGAGDRAGCRRGDQRRPRPHPHHEPGPLAESRHVRAKRALPSRRTATRWSFRRRPSSAPTNGAVVYVVTGDTAQRTCREGGLEKPDAVEILRGSTEGQTVLVSLVYGLGEKASSRRRSRRAARKNPEKPETP
jgi:hypothetical protein